MHFILFYLQKETIKDEEFLKFLSDNNDINSVDENN